MIVKYPVSYSSKAFTFFFQNDDLKFSGVAIPTLHPNFGGLAYSHLNSYLQKFFVKIIAKDELKIT